MKNRKAPFVLSIVTALLVGFLVGRLSPRPPTVTTGPAIVTELPPTAARVETPFDSELFLKQLDSCISNVEAGKETDPNCGSFTDWVEPHIIDLRVAGISKKQIEMRLDLILRLAKQKKYFSSYLQTVDQDGPDSLEKYLEEIKKGIQ